MAYWDEPPLPQDQIVIPTVERMEADFQAAPEPCLADSAFSTGTNLSSLQEQEVELVSGPPAQRRSRTLIPARACSVGRRWV